MNAFERLLGRTLFDGSDRGGGESSGSGSERDSERPWQLLTTLLSQNAQARGYAQRLLQQRAAADPASLLRRPDARQRLTVLLGLWPEPERLELAASLGLAAPGAAAAVPAAVRSPARRTVAEGAAAAWYPDAGLTVTASSWGDRQSPEGGGSETPRRDWSRSGETPTWGAHLSESPAPPREQYRRRSHTSPDLEGLGESVATLRRAAAPHGGGGGTGGVPLVSESASTAMPAFASERRGSSTLARSTSLDDWLLKRSSQVPSSRRASFQAWPSDADDGEGKLLLDFGPSSGGSAGSGSSLIGGREGSRSSRRAEAPSPANLASVPAAWLHHLARPPSTASPSRSAMASPPAAPAARALFGAAPRAAWDVQRDGLPGPCTQPAAVRCHSEDSEASPPWAQRERLAASPSLVSVSGSGRQRGGSSRGVATGGGGGGGGTPGTPRSARRRSASKELVVAKDATSWQDSKGAWHVERAVRGAAATERWRGCAARASRGALSRLLACMAAVARESEAADRREAAWQRLTHGSRRRRLRGLTAAAGLAAARAAHVRRLAERWRSLSVLFHRLGRQAVVRRMRRLDSSRRRALQQAPAPRDATLLSVLQGWHAWVRCQRPGPRRLVTESMVQADRLQQLAGRLMLSYRVRATLCCAAVLREAAGARTGRAAATGALRAAATRALLGSLRRQVQLRAGRALRAMRAAASWHPVARQRLGAHLLASTLRRIAGRRRGVCYRYWQRRGSDHICYALESMQAARARRATLGQAARTVFRSWSRLARIRKEASARLAALLCSCWRSTVGSAWDHLRLAATARRASATLAAELERERRGREASLRDAKVAAEVQLQAAAERDRTLASCLLRLRDGLAQRRQRRDDEWRKASVLGAWSRRSGAVRGAAARGTARLEGWCRLRLSGAGLDAFRRNHQAVSLRHLTGRAASLAESAQALRGRRRAGQQVLQRLAGNWYAAFDQCLGRACFATWLARHRRSKLCAMRQQQALKLLQNTCISAVRRQAWAPWCDWQQAVEQATLDRVLEWDSESLRAENLQLRDRLDALSTAAAAELEALRARLTEAEVLVLKGQMTGDDEAARRWQRLAAGERGRTVRRVAAALRAAQQRRAADSLVVSRWRGLAGAAAEGRRARTAAELRLLLAEASRLRGERTHLLERRGLVEAEFRSLALAASAAALGRDARLDPVLAPLRTLARARLLLQRAGVLFARAGLRKGWLVLAQQAKRQAVADAVQERHRALASRGAEEGVRALVRILVARGRLHTSFALGRLREMVKYGGLPRPVAVNRMARPLLRLTCRQYQSALASWRMSLVADCRRQRLGFLAKVDRGAQRRLLKRFFGRWLGRLRGPRRLAGVLARIARGRLHDAYSQLYVLAARQGFNSLQDAWLSSAMRRRRTANLRRAWQAWRAAGRTERLRQSRGACFQRRLRSRLCRTFLHGWAFSARACRKLRRLGAVLLRQQLACGLRRWRVTQQALGEAARHEHFQAVRQAVAKQRSDVERLVERRSRECASRTALALLHAWRCGTAAEAALAAQRRAAAALLAGLFAARRRGAARGALQRWAGSAGARRLAEAAEGSVGAVRAADRRRRMEQGCLLLASFVQHRQRLALNSALQGQWRSAKWQALVRTLDASAVREQRKLRAEAEAAQKGAAEAESLLTAAEGLREALWRSEEAEATALRRLAAAEARSGDDEEGRRRQKATEARLERLELDRAELRRQLADARGELHEESRATAMRGLALAEDAREWQQQARCSQEQAARAGLEARQFVGQAVQEVEDAAARRERELRERLQDVEHRAERQARASQLLEEQLQDREAALRKEQQKRQEKARLSASLSESKASLLEDQVSALKEQLQKEQAELRASERAWAGDRAVLLTTLAAASAVPAGLKAGGGGTATCCRSRGSSGGPSARRWPAGGGGAGGGHGGGAPDVCPWHSRSPAPVAAWLPSEPVARLGAV